MSSNILFTGLAEGFNKGPIANASPSRSDEVIVGHVLDVVLDSESEYYAGPESIGTVRIRNLQTQYNVRESIINLFARPLDRSNYRLPTPGEQVICVRAFGMEITGKYVASLHYIGVVSSESNILNNSSPFLGTDLKSIKGTILVNAREQSKRFEKKLIHDLKSLEGKTSISKLREGDKIVEGRYGGSIKFTSTIIADDTQTFNKGGSLDGDPLVIIKNNGKTKNGNLVYTEDLVDDDDVSIYLTTTQTIPVRLACSSRLLSWNINAVAGNITKGEDPSVIYQKIIDTTLPVVEAYKPTE
jgi:hypothetical protein